MLSARARTNAATVAVLALAAAVLGYSALSSAEGQQEGHAHATSVSRTDVDAATVVEWIELTTGHVLHAEPLSHPAASRLLAYTALALHEAVASVDPSGRSLAGGLHGDLEVPAPRAADGKLDAATTASSAAAAVLLGVLGEVTQDTREAVEDLTARQRDDRAAQDVAPDVRRASEAHGQQVAQAVVQRAQADGYAARNDKPYTPPTGTGVWELAAPATAPVEPHWGTLRPHVVDGADQFGPGSPPPYSADPTSVLATQAKQVYDTSRARTNEHRSIATFWAAGPAARWMTIAGDQALQRELPLPEATRVLALTGLAVADASIAAWTSKYELNVIRPVTYINRHIDPAWQPLLPTPGHPEYPAGHSAGAAAAETVLTALLGKGEVTARDAMGMQPPRKHPSFASAAAESAQSRIYAGAHYPVGLEAGTSQGQRIGELVLERLGTPTSRG